MTEMTQECNYSKKDFQSDIERRWCPGCGDYSIYNAVTSAFAELGLAKEKFAVISGIGCSSRFPYYMNTYGFHTLHGRAPTVAMGVKLANPELSVWVMTGDGDALSIGGNHFVHTIRRNPNINIIVFNNQIYGLTKGQTSPTSELGKVTKTTPLGSLDTPLQALPLALASGATFVARAIDTNTKMMKELFVAAAEHKGISVVEVLTNCVIFNNGAFQNFEEKATRDDHTVILEHGKPIKFGKDLKKGIILDGFDPKVVSLDNSTTKESDLLIYDAHCQNRTLAEIFAKITPSDSMPLPVGIFRDVNTEMGSYEKAVYEQRESYQKKKGLGNLDDLLNGQDSWQVH